MRLLGIALSLTMSLTAQASVATGPQQQAGAAPLVLGGSNYGLYGASDSRLKADLTALGSTGAEMIRIDLSWSMVESVRGQYDWRGPDRIVWSALAEGLQPLLLISTVPGWARPPGTTKMHAPTDPAAIRPFLLAAGRRYSAVGVQHWEIFNEVNTRKFWEPRPDPLAYVRLLKVAYRALKDAAPQSVVLNAGLVRAIDEPDGSKISPQKYLRAMYAAGAKGYFDALAWHPYTYPVGPLDASPANAFAQTPELRAILQANGDGAKKTWITEIGWPTCARGKDCVSTARQAHYMSLIILAWRADASHGPLFFYGLRDSSGSASKEHRFGFLNSDGSPKPVLAVLRSATGR